MSTYREEIEALDGEIRKLHDRKREMAERWAESARPVNPGQFMQVPRHAWTYCLKDMRVTSCLPTDKTGTWEWRVTGRVLKKDGALLRDGQAWVDFNLPMTAEQMDQKLKDEG